MRTIIVASILGLGPTAHAAVYDVSPGDEVRLAGGTGASPHPIRMPRFPQIPGS